MRESLRIKVKVPGASRAMAYNVLCSVLMLFGGLQAAFAAGDDKEEDYSKLPGYVDFASLGSFMQAEADVEIFLNQELLAMVSGMASFAEPELSEAVAKLKLVRVRKFDLDPGARGDVETKTRDMARGLEAKGWVRAVRVREDGEDVYVHFLLNKSLVHGITVMATEGREAAFVNIVGEIDPQQVGRIGRKFNVHGLDRDFWKEIEDLGDEREPKTPKRGY